MRYVTVRTASGTRGGRVEDDSIVVGHVPDAAAATVLGAFDGERMEARGAELGPVSIAPGKIVCLGLNYATHIAEMGRPFPEAPTVFAKFARALIGPEDSIVLPRVSDQVDWEAELAFVIGGQARHESIESAGEAIAGYTIINDVSVRDFQWRTQQWLAGKTFEATTPLGPEIVTPDEVDHAWDLEVRCEIDGKVVQAARTSDLVFSSAKIVSYVSQILTLDSGDVIATGTPGGVGVARNPKAFLKEGQRVRTVIEGIGHLDNRCVKEAPVNSTSGAH